MRSRGKKWTRVEQRVVQTPTGVIRITIEVPFAWHFRRTGERGLFFVPKESNVERARLAVIPRKEKLEK